MCEELKKRLLNEITAIERTKNKVELLEKLLVNEEYIIKFRDDPEYVKYWLLYSGLIRDVEKVFEFMDEAKIGIKDYMTYLKKAAFYENYSRDFLLSLACLDKALDLAPDQQLLTSTLKKFEQRMTARYERDVNSHLRENKKRRYS